MLASWRYTKFCTSKSDHVLAKERVVIALEPVKTWKFPNIPIYMTLSTEDAKVVAARLPQALVEILC
jgi:hypothetical protein